MPHTMIGFVYYEDDPDQKPFRLVLPSPDEDDSILDDPHWVTFGCNPERRAVMRKVPKDTPRGLTGTV